MAWYKTWFSKEYLSLYKHRDLKEAEVQVGFIVKLLGLTPRTLVLDVACGSGRHLQAFSKRKVRAVGIDLSQDLLQEARKSVPEQGLKALVRADMRCLPFGKGQFDLLTSFFTSFGYFPTDREHSELLREWQRVLKPGGRVFLDYLNRESVVRDLVEDSVHKSGKSIVTEKRRLSADKSRIEKEIEIHNNTTGKTKRFQESVRMFSLAELEVLLSQSGFVTEQVFGSFAGREFSPDTAERLVLVARTKKQPNAALAGAR